MPATVTLATTTLAASLGTSDRRVKLASTSGVIPGSRLFVDGELMAVVSLDVDPWVNVRRGVDGSRAHVHQSALTVYIGRPDQFYDTDPMGMPRAEILVSPHINVVNGNVWFAQGGALPNQDRYWAKQTLTYQDGAFGIPVPVYSPTSST
jgi:hypothetical protein